MIQRHSQDLNGAVNIITGHDSHHYIQMCENAAYMRALATEFTDKRWWQDPYLVSLPKPGHK